MKIKLQTVVYFYRPPTKLREGNVFTPVYQSVRGAGDTPLGPYQQKEHETRQEVTSYPHNYKSRWYTSYLLSFYEIKLILIQECIPVGCLPYAAAAVSEGGTVSAWGVCLPRGLSAWGGVYA